MAGRMIGIRVSITRCVRDDQPGFVECEFCDAHGRLHRFIDKVPVVATGEIDAASTYPQPGVIACCVVTRQIDKSGIEMIGVDTTAPWDVESTDGATCFDVTAVQLVEKEWGRWPLALDS